MNATTEIKQVSNQVQNASDDVITWVVWLARFGYAAKGVVYFTIGLLAFQAAIGSGGRTSGPSGALASIANQPMGMVLIGLLAVGLFGYAIWRVVQAWVDPEHEGSDMSGIVKRTGYVVSGIAYSFLGVIAVRILLGSGGGSNNDQAEDWTAQLMSQPYGIWLVWIVGVILVGTGLYQFYRAYSASFREKLKLHELSSPEETLATRAGRIGFAARGVVYCIIGGFLIVAAVKVDPDQAMGFGEALQTLNQQSYGPWLLGFVAVGLMAYGVFAVILARYRRIFIDA